jgi:hypothetical protein
VTRKILILAFFLLPSPTLTAQEGSGAPGAYIGVNAARLGGDLLVDLGDPGLPAGSTVILAVSDGYGPSTHPFLGPIWLDIASPAYQLILLPADASGNVHLELPIPTTPSFFFTPPIYGHAFTFGPTVPAPGWSLSKTVRVGFETLDGFNPVGPMLERRMLHTATSLARGPRDDQSKVFIAGGAEGSIIVPLAKATTEFFNPLTRAFEPGPTMTIPRSGHQASLMNDGRVFISGGAATGGFVTDSCEIYDPVANTLTPVASMGFTRVAHRQTVLSDGRILVSGGFASWIDAAINFVPVLNTAQSTTEIYDPTTGLWAPGPLMAANRAGHSQTLLFDGRVFIVAGITGGTTTASSPPGQVPNYTATCEIFDPVTNTLTPAAALPVPRGFHGASILNTGEVLVTGGAVEGVPQWGASPPGPAVGSADCRRFDGVSWALAPQLPATAMLHVQVRSRFNADAIVTGGYVGDFNTLVGSMLSARHNGTFTGATLNIGVHPVLGGTAAPVGAHQFTELYNGTYLLTGGSSQTTIRDEAWIIAEF